MLSALTPRIHAILRELDIQAGLSAQRLASSVGGITAETMLSTLGRLAKSNSRREAYVECPGGGRTNSQTAAWRLTDAGRRRIRGC